MNEPAPMCPGRIGVVIPTRTPDLALACVASLAGQVGADDIIVVATSDAAASRLRGTGGFQLVPDAPFRGYGAACNAGAERIREYELVVFSNDDIVFDAGSIAALARAVGDNPNAGFVGPRVRAPDGTPDPFAGLRPIRGWLVWPLALLMLPDRIQEARGRVLRGLAGPHLQFTGPVLAGRMEVFQAIGGFDEAIFMFLEEADVGQRCDRLGLAGAEVADASVTHWGSATHHGSETSHQWMEASTLYYAHKHWSFTQRTAYVILSMAVVMWNAVLLLLQGLLVRDGQTTARLRSQASRWPSKRLLWSRRQNGKPASGAARRTAS